jgi:hypothetical protein
MKIIDFLQVELPFILCNDLNNRRRMRWVEHVVCMGLEMHTKFWLGNLRGRDYLEELGIDRRMILKWILGKWGCWVWIGFIWLRIGTGGRLL